MGSLVSPSFTTFPPYIRRLLPPLFPRPTGVITTVTAADGTLDVLFLFVRYASFFVLAVLLFLPFRAVQQVVIGGEMGCDSFYQAVVCPIFRLFLFRFATTSTSKVLPIYVLLPRWDN